MLHVRASTGVTRDGCVVGSLPASTLRSFLLGVGKVVKMCLNDPNARQFDFTEPRPQRDSSSPQQVAALLGKAAHAHLMIDDPFLRFGAIHDCAFFEVERIVMQPSLLWRRLTSVFRVVVDWRRLRSRCHFADLVPMGFMEREVFSLLRTELLCVTQGDTEKTHARSSTVRRDTFRRPQEDAVAAISGKARRIWSKPPMC